MAGETQERLHPAALRSAALSAVSLPLFLFPLCNLQGNKPRVICPDNGYLWPWMYTCTCQYVGGTPGRCFSLKSGLLLTWPNPGE